MNYSIEILNKIEEFAAALITPHDIAVILEVQPKEFIDELKDVTSDVYKAFYRGYLQKELDIRQKNLLPLDVDTEDFTLTQLKDFKSKLIIQLDG
ncbi:MAG: hypothetical protein P1P88_01215 [Bacteroidales bacterium]|nr:hypothetical protein [Bacteroidales bacterium]